MSTSGIAMINPASQEPVEHHPQGVQDLDIPELNMMPVSWQGVFRNLLTALITAVVNAVTNAVTNAITNAISIAIDQQSSLLISEQAARVLCGGVTKSTWDRWDSKGIIPAPVRIGGRVFWERWDIEKWLEWGRPGRTRFDVLKCNHRDSSKKGNKR